VVCGSQKKKGAANVSVARQVGQVHARREKDGYKRAPAKRAAARETGEVRRKEIFG
jgi:hypothetical protein